MHRLHRAPAARHSEDIDLVQRAPGPDQPDALRLLCVLGWIGPVRFETGEHLKLTFRLETEVAPRARSSSRSTAMSTSGTSCRACCSRFRDLLLGRSLLRPGVTYDPAAALDWVGAMFIPLPP